MRRIYDSQALSRDDADPFQPGVEEDTYRPQSFRALDAGAWTDRIVPHGLRCRAISVDLSLPQREFAVGEPIPFAVEMSNAVPLPLTIRTASPVLWRWQVDGHPDASRITQRTPPEQAGAFRFERGERKRFRKEWGQRFRVSDRRWTAAEPGEHTIRVEINVADPDGAGLAAEASVLIRE